MAIPHVAFVAMGAAAVGVVRGLGRSEGLHDGVVRLTAAGMRAADAVRAATQTVVDEASDVNAEARRMARIDAAVKERLDEIEKGVRAEVTAEIDGIESGE